MSKPAKKRTKPYKKENHRLPTEEHDLTSGEFMTLGYLQKTIQDAQQAQATFLTNIAATRLGYKEGLQLGFQVDYNNGKVKVDIVRNVQEEEVSGKMDSQTK